jgi:hypothetical protein
LCKYCGSNPKYTSVSDSTVGERVGAAVLATEPELEADPELEPADDELLDFVPEVDELPVVDAFVPEEVELDLVPELLLLDLDPADALDLDPEDEAEEPDAEEPEAALPPDSEPSPDSDSLLVSPGILYQSFK